MADAWGNESTRLKEKASVQRETRYGSASVQEEVPYLQGELPFFDVVLTKSQVERLILPVHMVQLLPRAIVPVILTYGGKNWNLSYRGESVRPTFDSGWRGFVTDNYLKCGDACLFELLENSRENLKFKVIILRGDLPPELVAMVDSRGKSFDSPIVLD